MPLVGYEPTISADERPQVYVLDRVATEKGKHNILILQKICYKYQLLKIFLKRSGNFVKPRAVK